MRKVFFDLLSKEKVLSAVFLTVFIILVLIRNPIQAFNVITKPLEKIASPLPLTTPTPIPTLTPTPTITSTPARKPTRAPTKIPLPTFTPIPTTTPTPDKKSPDNAAVWESIAACESNGNWSENTSNGYFGGLQFSQGAWNSVGGSGNPSQASKDEQISRGKMLENLRGWGVWGACAAKLGLN